MLNLVIVGSICLVIGIISGYIISNLKQVKNFESQMQKEIEKIKFQGKKEIDNFEAEIENKVNLGKEAKNILVENIKKMKEQLENL